MDIAEAIDDPATTEKVKRKLFALRMHHEGAKAGFIAKVLNVHQNSITNYLKQYRVMEDFQPPLKRVIIVP